MAEIKPAAARCAWSALVTYRRSQGEWPEAVCAENMREAARRVRQVPQAEKPDF
jgi:hypothetical protein